MIASRTSTTTAPTTIPAIAAVGSPLLLLSEVVEPFTELEPNPVDFVELPTLTELSLMLVLVFPPDVSDVLGVSEVSEVGVVAAPVEVFCPWVWGAAVETSTCKIIQKTVRGVYYGIVGRATFMPSRGEMG